MKKGKKHWEVKILHGVAFCLSKRSLYCCWLHPPTCSDALFYIDILVTVFLSLLFSFLTPPHFFFFGKARVRDRVHAGVTEPTEYDYQNAFGLRKTGCVPEIG